MPKIVAETAICQSNYDGDRNVLIVLLYIVAIALVILGMFAAWMFSKKTQLFPLKGRAPRFAIIQMFYFILLNLIPLFVEGLIGLQINWNEDSGENKRYITRDFLKSMYFLLRFWCYLIYGFR